MKKSKGKFQKASRGMNRWSWI